MIIGAVVGLLVAHPAMNLAPYTGFHNEKSGDLFPILFVTVACGAVSGFHSLVSSGTSSKAITNEKDMPKVGFGAMLLESLLLPLMARLQPVLRLLSSPPVLPDSWRCSASRFTLPSAL